jgi:hypothetical protein
VSNKPPKLIKVDPSKPETDSIISEFGCNITNDTDATYILFFTYENSLEIAELWSQTPGQTRSLLPTLEVYIMPVGHDVVTEGSALHYAWAFTTQAQSTFRLSTMSY